MAADAAQVRERVTSLEMTRRQRVCPRRRGTVTGVGSVFAVLAGLLWLTPVAAATTAADNFVGNSSFEAGTSGWNTVGASGVTLTQAPDGMWGGYAAKVTNTSSSSVDSCSLNDAPNWVRQTAAGAYYASVFVRADSPGATLTWRVREYGTTGTRLGVATRRIALTTTWQQVLVALSVTSPGSTLDLTAYVSNAAPGTCFYADSAWMAKVTPNNNLVRNPWFEQGTAGTLNPWFDAPTSGWNTTASGVSLSQVAGGHSGSYAAEVTNTTGAAVESCALNDAPNWVRETSAGSYLAAMWVRGPAATLTLRLREYSPTGVRLAAATRRIDLTSDWQQVAVTLPVTSPGSTLDLTAYVVNAPPGTCFHADDAALIHAPPAAPAQVITFDEFTAASNVSYPSAITTMGFRFAPSGIINSSRCAGVTCIDNGTPYLWSLDCWYSGDCQLITMTKIGGGAFNLLAFDGGPLHTDRSEALQRDMLDAVQIYVVGTKTDGTHVSAVLSVTDPTSWYWGAFQHLTLPSTFTDLTSVTFYGDYSSNPRADPTTQYALTTLDNIAVTAAP
jgi:hypothetical protein